MGKTLKNLLLQNHKAQSFHILFLAMKKANNSVKMYNWIRGDSYQNTDCKFYKREHLRQAAGYDSYQACTSTSTITLF